ncbi:MAG TPA: glycoside hydrolase family 125 protein [Candidatus Dormibacteraeota bacterium]|nr:glycoside hydrolase family 125 protein [Candidatus Dormibacteraeota bacterium]
MNRRTLLASAVAASIAAAWLPPSRADALELPSIEAAADAFRSPNARLQVMFRAALLSTTKLAQYASDGTAYVKTGDIPAEWLRDSSAQVRPYLFFAKDDPSVARLLQAIIARQARYLTIDPYANAFTLDYKVWEEKYELDSLCYPIVLAWTYWKTTGDVSIFDPVMEQALTKALETMEREQDHDRSSTYTQKEMPNGGKGNPVAYTGMIWSAFRPSDDACQYNYLIPSEMMAVVALGDLEDIFRAVYRNVLKAERAKSLRSEVQDGIQQFGIVFTPNYGYVYAYEVDGLGHSVLMDDANIPSLLSAPYLGYTKPDARVYQNTRRFLLSKNDPYYYAGKFARGIGSAHTPDGYVWPLSLLMQGMTTTSQAEKEEVLKELLDSDPGDHLLHESFDPNNPTKFTRVDFGWPNALFSEFVMTSFGGRTPLPLGDTSDLEFRGE